MRECDSFSSLEFGISLTLSVAKQFGLMLCSLTIFLSSETLEEMEESVILSQ